METNILLSQFGGGLSDRKAVTGKNDSHDTDSGKDGTSRKSQKKNYIKTLINSQSRQREKRRQQQKHRRKPHLHQRRMTLPKFYPMYQQKI